MTNAKLYKQLIDENNIESLVSTEDVRAHLDKLETEERLMDQLIVFLNGHLENKIIKKVNAKQTNSSFGLLSFEEDSDSDNS